MENKKNILAISLVVMGIIISYQLAAKFYGFLILGGGMGFVDVGGYVIPYQEDSSLIIGLISLALSVISLIVIINIKNIKIQNIIGASALIISILGHIIWSGLNPMYKFDHNPESMGYMDSKKEYIEDTEKYVELLQNYGGKFSSSFRSPRTLEEHVRIIDVTLEKNWFFVYEQAVKSAGKIYGYDELFKAYPDKTLQTDYLDTVFAYSEENYGDWLYESYEGFYYLKDHGLTKTIKDASRELYNGYEVNKNKLKIDFFDSDDDYIDQVEWKYSKKLDNEPGLNHRVLIWWKYKKDKFVRDENGDYNMVKDYYMKNEHDKVNWY